jgi:hypothetical protein
MRPHRTRNGSEPMVVTNMAQSRNSIRNAFFMSTRSVKIRWEIALQGYAQMTWRDKVNLDGDLESALAQLRGISEDLPEQKRQTISEELDSGYRY